MDAISAAFNAAAREMAPRIFEVHPEGMEYVQTGLGAGFYVSAKDMQLARRLARERNRPMFIGLLADGSAVHSTSRDKLREDPAIGEIAWIFPWTETAAG